MMITTSLGANPEKHDGYEHLPGQTGYDEQIANALKYVTTETGNLDTYHTAHTGSSDAELSYFLAKKEKGKPKDPDKGGESKPNPSAGKPPRTRSQ